MKYKRGFTLIELLVTIAIIGLLSSVIFASIASARRKALDVQRIASAKQIAQAIEFYFDTNGTYPNWAISPYASSGGVCGYGNTWCTLETSLSPYISSLPKDPTLEVRWQYKRANNLWGLSVILDSSNDISMNDGGYYTNRFELGTLPGYCLNKYSGSNANWANPWIGEGSWTACSGGN